MSHRTYRVFCRDCTLTRQFSYRATAEACAETHVTHHQGHEAVLRWWARYRYHDRIYGKDATRGTIVQRVVVG